MNAEVQRLSDADILSISFSTSSISSITAETNALIEGALEAVRKTARLDDDPILLPLPATTPRRDVMMLSRADLPLPARKELEKAKTELAKPIEIKIIAEPRRPSSRLPVLLCAFVASVFAGAAFMASPLGHRPGVQHAVGATQAKVSGALSVAKTIVHR